MAAAEVGRARQRVLHEFWAAAPLAVALVALLPTLGCTARFSFMEPVVVYTPPPPPVVVRR